MIICIEVDEKDYRSMNAQERLHLLREGYGRSKTMQLQAINYQKRLEICNMPRMYASAVLDEKQERILEAYEAGVLGGEYDRKAV